MLIYVNGDSHTAGVGLGDEHLFPEYPGHQQKFDWNILSHWSTLRTTLIRERKLEDISTHENYKRCWATQLGVILNAEIVNEAVGGSSGFAILTRTIHDIENLIKKNKIPDEVIIGITTPERIAILNKDPSSLNDSFWVYTAHPNYIDSLDIAYRNYAKEFWKSHNDEELLTFFLYECLHIKNYVNSKIGKDPIFLNTSNVFYRYSNIVENTKIQLLKEVWGLLDFDSVHKQKSFSDIARGRGAEVTACGHYLETSHKDYATYIADNLIKSL